MTNNIPTATLDEIAEHGGPTSDGAGWHYAFPNGYQADVIIDKSSRRPFRFLASWVDAGGNYEDRPALTSEEAVAAVAAVYGLPAKEV